MARFNPIKNSFVAGELDPRLEGRDDLPQYFQGMRQALNGIVLAHGGFMRRSGSQFVKEVKDSADEGRLITFEQAVDQAYVVELGNLYARFYTNEGRLETGGSPVEVVTPYLSTELYDIQWGQDADILYVVHPNHPPHKMTRLTPTSFDFSKVVFTGGEAPMQPDNLTTTTLTVTGSGPFTLTGSAAMFVVADDVGRGVRAKAASDEGWFLITSVGSTTVATADLKGGTAPTGATLDWALGLFSDTQGARSVTLHEGRLAYGGSVPSLPRYVLSNSDDFDRFGNDATLDDNSISRLAISGQGKVNAIQWLVSVDEALFIGTSGAEFKGRGANDDIMTPSGTVTKSKTSRGSAHILPILIDNRVIFMQRNARRMRQLKFDIGADALIAQDISILGRHLLQKGVLELNYQQDPESVIWATRTDGVLVGFTFEGEQSIIGGHRHVFGGSFDTGDAVCESAAVIANPGLTEDQLWVLVKRTINGVTKRYVEFVTKSFEPDITRLSTLDERIQAIEDDAFFIDSGLELADDPKTITNITQANPGVVTSAAHGLSNGDQVKIVDVVGMVEVNKGAFLIANVAANTFELQDLQGDNLDTTGFTAYGSAGVARIMVDVISGLGHLDGETIQILADGAVHPDKVVASGSVTLDRKAAKARVGLGYETIGETQRFIGGGRIGTDQGQKTKIRHLVFRFLNTLGARAGVGPDPEFLEDVLFRDGQDPMDNSPPLFSGDKKVSVPSSWTTEPTAYFIQDQPLPLTVLAIMPRAQSTDRE